MVTDDIARRYNTLSAEDRRTFDRWLNANAAGGLIIAVGLVAMALTASNSARPRDATFANNRNVSDLVASEKRQERSGVWARQKVEVHEKKF
jgi:hypothetical protein